MGVDTLKLVGRTIADKYVVEAVVGEGGFATVYRAMHLLWKRPVALKVFKAFRDFSADDRKKLLAEFVQEGALLADLSAQTASIVQARDIAMIDAGDGEQVPYMVLEWLEGASLEQVLEGERDRGAQLRTLDETVRLLNPIAEALALAHRKGIAHRDVKPANVFIVGDARGEPTVKLLDFGIAKVVSNAQKIAGTFAKTSGMVTSFTPAYGAPEQFSRSHGATGPWTDVFALALVVVETSSGREPIDGDDFVQLAFASSDPMRRPTPRALGVAVPDAVEAVFEKALSVRPGDRWQTAGDFWVALLRAMRAAPGYAMADAMPRASSFGLRPLEITAPTVPVAPSPASRPGAGKAGLWLGLGAAALLAIGGGASFFFRSLPSTNAGAVAASVPAGAAMPAAALAPSAVPAGAGACPDGMLLIPGGSFFMGSDEGLPLERPAHQVVVGPYCIDKYEVTVDRYKACSDAGRCKRAGTTNQWADITDAERKAFDPLCNVRDPDVRKKHPINCVDWDMADKFCREDGKRLPAEAEWEFAARGPDGRKYPWGDDDPTATFLNACGRECMQWGEKNGIPQKAMYDVDDGYANTAPVGSFPKGASRYGLEDVVGNVWEWVADYYGPYSKDEQRQPTGPARGDERVIRGGAWNGSYASWVRPTFRYKDAPEKRSYGIGFRCAR
ncbi:MAG: bifunctional serine/threonine-protein kinase/formylglycine-generating enzyme family protein [Polyangiaceae bacterium]|nr:bifunctional serine/threonine-protein kinase/formylglycine-generating enzyme family protein [Polyangiaceae bacterium]